MKKSYSQFFCFTIFFFLALSVFLYSNKCSFKLLFFFEFFQAYQHIFFFSSSVSFPGCALLAVKYPAVFLIGTDVLAFEIFSPVVNFVATVQNSGVVYGFVDCEDGVYVHDSINCSSGFIRNDERENYDDFGCVQNVRQKLVHETRFLSRQN